jgi:poly(3-hydroxybutyrate) depolymerase
MREQNHFLSNILAAAVLSALVMPAMAAEPQRVTFASADRQATPLTGYLLRPAGGGPFPAIVALHGCSGVGSRDRVLSQRHADWGDRLVRAGYVVLFPDSFGPRGAKSLCSTRDRVIRPAGRADDARGAAAWLAASRSSIVAASPHSAGRTVDRRYCTSSRAPASTKPSRPRSPSIPAAARC